MTKSSALYVRRHYEKRKKERDFLLNANEARCRGLRQMRQACELIGAHGDDVFPVNNSLDVALLGLKANPEAAIFPCHVVMHDGAVTEIHWLVPPVQQELESFSHFKKAKHYAGGKRL